MQVGILFSLRYSPPIAIKFYIHFFMGIYAPFENAEVVVGEI